MDKEITSIGFGVVALTALVINTPTAFAETVNVKANLNASASVPPTTAMAPETCRQPTTPQPSS